MLRPIVALGIFAGGAVRLRNTATQRNCVAAGSVAMGGFSAQTICPDRAGAPIMAESTMTRRAVQPERLVMVQLSHLPATDLEAALPLGQEERVLLGRRAGARLSDTELRARLRVVCTPA